MKKIVIIVVAAIMVASCNKKASPSASNNGTGNTSGVAATASNNTPVTAEKAATSATVAVNTNTNPESQASKTTREPGQLSPEQHGQATYSTKCGRCHGLKVTTDYTVDRWITVMQVMALKAKLSDEEKENVLAYVKANAKKG